MEAGDNHGFSDLAFSDGCFFGMLFDLVMSMINFSPDWHLFAKPEIGDFPSPFLL